MHKFYALLARMSYINRWSLMRNSRNENVAEHSHNTAMIANALAIIERDVFGQSVDPDRCTVYAVYHEAAEVMTGDLPTPIKYYNDSIRTAYKDIERQAEQRLLEYLPKELKGSLSQSIQPPDCIEKQLVKCADKIAALIKCKEEVAFGNKEFKTAYDSTLKALETSNYQSVKYFLENFLEAYTLSLDELME